MAWQVFMLRVGVAALLGAVIGLERQVRQRLAGLRTNALVSIGAAAFVALAAATPAESSPTRVAAQVVSGIGFLGAGVIFREGLTVRGFNTAATLWCSGAVGSLAGSGMYGSGGITAVLALLANTLLRPVARRLDRDPTAATEVEVRYRIAATCVEADEPHIRSLLLQGVMHAALVLQSIRSTTLVGEGGEPARARVRAEVVTEGRSDRAIEQVVGRLSLEPGVSEASWRIADPAVTD